jgi:hypothetical protein
MCYVCVPSPSSRPSQLPTETKKGLSSAPTDSPSCFLRDVLVGFGINVGRPVPARPPRATSASQPASEPASEGGSCRGAKRKRLFFAPLLSFSSCRCRNTVQASSLHGVEQSRLRILQTKTLQLASSWGTRRILFPMPQRIKKKVCINSIASCVACLPASHLCRFLR